MPEITIDMIYNWTKKGILFDNAHKCLADILNGDLTIEDAKEKCLEAQFDE